MRIALLALLPLLSSCATYETFYPLGDPILATDKVKTKEQAIRIAMNCGSERGDPHHWQVTRHRDIWYVYWENGQNEIDVQVAKNDGMILSCTVNDASAPPR